jgi:hypothetical protein
MYSSVNSLFGIEISRMIMEPEVNYFVHITVHFPSIKMSNIKAVSITFSSVNTGLNKRKRYAVCLVF